MGAATVLRSARSSSVTAATSAPPSARRPTPGAARRARDASDSPARELRRTLTWDQGSEMARHDEIADLLSEASSSPTRAGPGSAAPTRTRTVSCASTSPRAPTSPSIPPNTSPPSRTGSTPDPGRDSHGEHPPGSSPPTYSPDDQCCDHRPNSPPEAIRGQDSTGVEGVPHTPGIPERHVRNPKRKVLSSRPYERRSARRSGHTSDFRRCRTSGPCPNRERHRSG